MEGAQGPARDHDLAADRDLLQKLYALEDLLTEDERDVVFRCGEWVTANRTPLSPDSRRMLAEIWKKHRP